MWSKTKVEKYGMMSTMVMMPDLDRDTVTYCIHILIHAWVCIKYLGVANWVIFTLDNISSILWVFCNCFKNSVISLIYKGIVWYCDPEIKQSTT